MFQELSNNVFQLHVFKVSARISEYPCITPGNSGIVFELTRLAVKLRLHWEHVQVLLRRKKVIKVIIVKVQCIKFDVRTEAVGKLTIQSSYMLATGAKKN